MPGRCKSPIPPSPVPANWLPPAPGEGVRFVFSGYSRLEVSGAAMAEICGMYAGGAAPMAIYGDPTALPPGLSCDATNLPCGVLQTAPSFEGLLTPPFNILNLPPPQTLYVQGTIYAPTRDVAVILANDKTPTAGVSTQRYTGGTVVRRLWVGTVRAVGQPAVFSVPPVNTLTVRRTLVRLEIAICPGQSTCTSGTVRLSAKVRIDDTGGVPVAGARQITVLNWSVQR
jgi:hypothetical protein